MENLCFLAVLTKIILDTNGPSDPLLSLTPLPDMPVLEFEPADGFKFSMHRRLFPAASK